MKKTTERLHLPRTLLTAVDALTPEQWEKYAEPDALWIMTHLGIAMEPYYDYPSGKASWSASYRARARPQGATAASYPAFIKADTPSAALRALLRLPRPLELPVEKKKSISVRQLHQTQMAFLKSVVLRATGVLPGQRRKRPLPKRGE